MFFWKSFKSCNLAWFRYTLFECWYTLCVSKIWYKFWTLKFNNFFDGNLSLKHCFFQLVLELIAQYDQISTFVTFSKKKLFVKNHFNFFNFMDFFRIMILMYNLLWIVWSNGQLSIVRSTAFGDKRCGVNYSEFVVILIG